MNRRLSQLNRLIARNGDAVTLRRYTGTAPNRVATDLTMKAKVKGLVSEQLIGNVTVQTYVVVLSPTPIIKDGWPHATGTPSGSEVIDPVSSARLPTTADKVLVNARERAIGRVVPTFELGVCVRIELTATG